MAQEYSINELVLLDQPSQTMDVAMNGQRVKFHFKYNTRSDHWTFDLYRGNVALLHGKKLVLGIDLLERYSFGLGSVLCHRFINREEPIEPNRSNLPKRDVRLYLIWQQRAA